MEQATWPLAITVEVIKAHAQRKCDVHPIIMRNITARKAAV